MTDVPIEEMLFNGVAWVCIAAWRALPLLCIVLVFDLLLRRRIAARFHCLLWMVVAARMLCPFSVESSLSLHGNLLTTLEAVGFSNSQTHAPHPLDAQNLEIDADTYTFQNETGDAVTVTQPRPTEDLHQDSRFKNAAAYSSPQSHALVSDAGEPAPFDPEILLFCGIAGIWLIVACILLIRGVVQSLRFSRQLRRSRLITEQSVIDEVLRACDAVGVGRRPALKEVHGISVPAVFGIRRPTICLPTGTIGELSSRDLRLVLLHELAHVKRRDGLVLSLCLFVRALHWFNPMVWLVLSRIRNYMEQAADEIAMQKSAASESTDYGRLLLRYASSQPQPRHLAAIGLLFTSPGKQIARRINMLDGSDQRNHWLARVFALATVVTLAVTGLTDAKTVEQMPPASPLHVPRVSDSWKQLRPSFQLAPEPAPATTTRVYDVTEVLAMLQETQPDRDAESYLANIVAAGQSTLSKNKLTVNVTAKRHDSVIERLAQLARNGHWEIQFEVRFIQVSLDQVADLGVDWIADAVQPEIHQHPQHKIEPDSEAVLVGFEEPTNDRLVIKTRQTDSPSRPVLGVKVSDDQVRRFIQRTAVDPRSTMMLAPKVRLFDGMTARISDEVIRPFVTGMRPDDASSKREMKPVIDCFSEGFRFHVRGDVTDQERIRIRCALTMSRLEDVAMANLPIVSDGDSGARLTVQVPQARSFTVQAEGTLQRNESLLLTCPTTFTSEQPRQESHALCYLVTPRWARDFRAEDSQPIQKQTARNDESASADSDPAANQPVFE